MFTPLRKAVSIGLPAIGLSLLAISAQADVLPVQNLTFDTYSGAAPKNSFAAVDPADWYRGTPGPNGDLVYIDAPGTATSFTGGYGVAGPFANPPPGGNFVQADGNPTFESSFNQDISGLTVGKLYTLSFWQAAGQQVGFPGATTEQWVVALGATGSALDVIQPSSNPGFATYFDTDGSAVIQTTAVMNTPQQGVSPWEEVTMSFTAVATQQTLSFLAWGNNGNTANQPPTVFLAGVNSPAVPEPTTMALFGIGLLGFGASRLRRPAKRTEEV